MSKVRILPEALSNKIAAGEVVERPASVVRELVENSLDAGSSRIIVEVEKGGRSLIQVSDNGSGMNRDDALLAVERYATSKIYTDDDLFAIRTLGFRGEALPSIASVSQFALETRDAGSDAGTRIEIAGGTLKNVSETGAPVGTLISVRRIFFNTPARRKFLKAVNTEMAHISDTVANIALGWPDVHFRLIHNGKLVRNWQAVTDPAERASDVLGREIRGLLFPVRFTGDGLSLGGWVAGSQISRATSRSVYVYVNGRFVKDRTIQHALVQGYAGRLMKGQYPVAVLMMDIPPDQVDVNVHPAKSEVRFARQQDIHKAVADAVAEALRQAERPAQKTPEPENRTPDLPHTGESFTAYRPLPADIPSRPPGNPAKPFSPSPEKDNFQGLFIKEETGAFGNTISPETRIPPGKKPEESLPLQKPLWAQRRFGDMRIIGQFHNTYILCEAEGSLILVDQHAAHERVLFEEIRHQAEQIRGHSQALLIPETIEVSYTEATLLEKLVPALDRTGILVEPFGGNTFVVRSVPPLLHGRPVQPLIIEMLEKMTDADVETGAEKVMDDFLMLMACHGAIRAGQALSSEEMTALLKQMDRCENPSNCPHGRPTWIKWSARFLEKTFRRIV